MKFSAILLLKDLFLHSLLQKLAHHLRLKILNRLRNDLINVQQDQLSAFQNMDAVQHLTQAVFTALDDGGLAEGHPLEQHGAQRLRNRLAINAHHGEVDTAGGLQAGVRKQLGNELFLRHRAGLGLKDQAGFDQFAVFSACACCGRSNIFFGCNCGCGCGCRFTFG